MRFFVRIYRYAGDYSALVPDLPGCVAVAESVEKVRKQIAEAIWLHLDLMRRSGERIPQPTRRLQLIMNDKTEEEICTWVEVKRPKMARVRAKR